MVSIFSLFYNLFFSSRLIKVRRLPSRKVLRAHQLGLTFGFFLVLFASFLSISNHSGLELGGQPAYVSLPLILFIFACGSSIFSGLFVAIVGFAVLVGFPDTAGAPFWAFWLTMANAYFIGYLFGAVFAILYNDLVFLQLIFCQKDLVKLAFVFDRKKKVQILKSPVEQEETALLQVLKPVLFYTSAIRRNLNTKTNAETLISLIKKAFAKMTTTDRIQMKDHLSRGPGITDADFLTSLPVLEDALTSDNNDTRSEAVDKVENLELLLERYLELKKSKLYNYRVLNPPPYPYTIAFVANPRILKRGKSGNDASHYEKDPIIDDLDLFLRSVDRAMASLESDEIVGRPEIWSRVRIIAVFDPKLADADGTEYGLLQPYHNSPVIAGDVADNLIDPMKQMHENYIRMIRRETNFEVSTKLTLDSLAAQTDVIFALSASREWDRSTAHYADWLEDVEVDENPDAKGKTYAYDADPEITKPFMGAKMEDLSVARCKPNTDPLPRRFTCVHDHYSNHPGRIALNVLGASAKTVIHEFGHAMSSAFHGAIVDEYFERYELLEIRYAPLPDEEPMYYVNRIDRKLKNDGTVLPVHTIFARYNNADFFSDLDHPSGEEDWTGYFPNRKNTAAVCTMDRNYPYYRFDELLSSFIYDRLMTKINRQTPPPPI